MKTIPDQHLFTVRGRPVMFRKDEAFFGALHATERGHFPVSHTGYYSLSQFTLHAREHEHCDFLDLLSEDFLETLAAEKERITNEILRSVLQCSRRNGTGRDDFIQCAHSASLAFEHGLFATDAQRWQLWQASHETYSRLFDHDSIRLVDDDDRYFLRCFENELRTFDALCQCMRGEFSCEKAVAHPFAIRLAGYFELPPRPEGEPVIPIPAQTLEFDFGN